MPLGKRNPVARPGTVIQIVDEYPSQFHLVVKGQVLEEACELPIDSTVRFLAAVGPLKLAEFLEGKEAKWTGLQFEFLGKEDGESCISWKWLRNGARVEVIFNPPSLF